MRLEKIVNNIPVTYSLRMALFSWSKKSQELTTVTECLNLIRRNCCIFKDGVIDTIDVRSKGKSSKRDFTDKNWDLMLSRLREEKIESISFYNKGLINEPPNYEATIFINKLSERYYYQNNYIDIRVPLTENLQVLANYRLLFQKLIVMFDADYGFGNVYMESTDVRAEALVFSKLIDCFPIDCVNHRHHEGEIMQIKDINWINFLGAQHLSQINEIPSKLCSDYKKVKEGLYFSISETPFFEKKEDKERIRLLRNITRKMINESSWYKRHLGTKGHRTNGVTH